MHSRRHFLSAGYGVGTVALATLLREQGLYASTDITGEGRVFDNLPKPPHSFGRAKAMIFCGYEDFGIVLAEHIGNFVEHFITGSILFFNGRSTWST